jgi:hypothetical protein
VPPPCSGTAAYRRSGQLHDLPTQRLSSLLTLSAIVTTPLGVLANASISGHAFGILLGQTIFCRADRSWG